MTLQATPDSQPPFDMDGAIVHTWSAEGVFDDRVTFPLGPEVIELANGPFSPGWTVAELDAALDAVETHDGAVYIEVMIPDEESQPLPEDVIDRGYKLRTPGLG